MKKVNTNARFSIEAIAFVIGSLALAVLCVAGVG